jgi:hypothetical protein
VAALAGRERCLGCVITIGAGMYEPGHAIRTDRSGIGFKIGEHDGKVTDRAERLAKIMCDVAPSKVTTNLWGERWSKLSVNCMANGLAGLSGLGSAEVRTKDGVRRVAIHLAAEAILVGRARGHEVEPIWGIEAQRFVDAVQGRGLADVERDMAERAKELAGGRPSLLQDVMRGRRTEVQYLNGSRLRAGTSRPASRHPSTTRSWSSSRACRQAPQADPKNLEPLVGMLRVAWTRSRSSGRRSQAHERLMATLGGLTDADATWRPAPHANTILEIAWHVARVDDRLGRRSTGLGPELWTSQGWSERLGTTKDIRQRESYQFLKNEGAVPPRLDDIRAYLVALHADTLENCAVSRSTTSTGCRIQPSPTATWPRNCAT